MKQLRSKNSPTKKIGISYRNSDFFFGRSFGVHSRIIRVLIFYGLEQLGNCERETEVEIAVPCKLECLISLGPESFDCFPFFLPHSPFAFAFRFYSSSGSGFESDSIFLDLNFHFLRNHGWMNPKKITSRPVKINSQPNWNQKEIFMKNSFAVDIFNRHSF